MEKKNKIIVTAIAAVIIIIAISVIGWNIQTSGSEFKVTVLNLSGEDIMAYIFAFNHTNDYFDAEVTTNGLDNNASRSFNFKPLCKEFTVVVETRTELPDDTEIAHASHYFHNNKLYDLLIIIQNSGETITITKMP